MTSDWMPVIGISVAVMALVQVGTIIAVLVAVRRMQTTVQAVEHRVEEVMTDLRPRVEDVVTEARAASVTANELLTDIRRHLDTMEQTAHVMRARMHRVVDSVAGVASAAGTLPGPVKVSGPAAMAVWAGVKAARSIVGRVRFRRRERRLRRRFQDEESYLGIG